MRLLHTADWHLGQTLHGLDRAPEHARFLAWLLDHLEAEAVDVLLVAGDVFDVASPGSSAQRQYYGFLADARARCPNLDIVVVGGNHDSPARLQAPAELLGRLGIRVVGGLPPGAAPDAPVDLDAFVVPVTGRDGETGRVVALPFLRPRDLPGTRIDPAGPGAAASVIEAHRALVHAAFERARGHGPVVATGHCYMVGGATSDDSERKIQIGYQAALPADIYPEDAAYVALGHLHRAQAVEGHPHIRYSGSPIPLSMSERDYAHQVVVADVDASGLTSWRALSVPRFRALEAVPEAPADLDRVLALLEARPAADEDDEALEPLVEVRVRLDGPAPRLRAQIEAALTGKRGRLARLAVERSAPTAEAPAARTLDQLRPDEVVALLWRRARGGELPPDVLALFHELLAEAEAEPSADETEELQASEAMDEVV